MFYDNGIPLLYEFRERSHSLLFVLQYIDVKCLGPGVIVSCWLHNTNILCFINNLHNQKKTFETLRSKLFLEAVLSIIASVIKNVADVKVYAYSIRMDCRDLITWPSLQR
jgi:hypothetical protein